MDSRLICLQYLDLEPLLKKKKHFLAKGSLLHAEGHQSHHGAIQPQPGAMESHPGAIVAHLEAIKAHHGVSVAELRSTEVHP